MARKPEAETSYVMSSDCPAAPQLDVTLVSQVAETNLRRPTSFI